MAIQEKITQEDIIFYEIMRHPVLAMEFVHNVDLRPEDTPFEYTYYQKEMACDFHHRVGICAARAIGKTLVLSGVIIWLLINKAFPNDPYIVYLVPGKAQLEPVFSALVMAFRGNSLLKQFIASNKGINGSDYNITLLNNAKLDCRIAGTSGTGANVIGLHTPFVIVDEAGYFPHSVFMEMQPIMNTWVPGTRLIVSGVPTGMREKNILWLVDQEDENYTKHRVSALQNPRFSEQDYKNAVEVYGGEDSDDFIRFIKGDHGLPVFSIFDRTRMAIESYPVNRLILDGTKLQSDIHEYHRLLNILPPISGNPYVLMGVDLGFEEPTAIYVITVDTHGRLKFHAKIQLNRVNYNIQERLIDYLDTKFKVHLIGMDEGGIGKVVRHHLQDELEFHHKNYKNKLIPVSFGSWIELGKDSNGDVIKTEVRPYSITLLQEYINSQRIIFSSTEPEIMDELERMTYVKNPTNGKLVYKTLTPGGGRRGSDHFTAALLSAVFAYYTTEELVLINPHRKLASPRWM